MQRLVGVWCNCSSMQLLCNSVHINNVVCSIHQPPAKPSLSTDNIHKHQPCSNTPHYQELHRVIYRYMVVAICCHKMVAYIQKMQTCVENPLLYNNIEKLPSPLHSSTVY